MSKIVKRYKRVEIKGRREIVSMAEAEFGDWIRWEDHRALLEEQYVALSTLKKLEDVARGCEGLAIKYFEAIEFLKEEVK